MTTSSSTVDGPVRSALKRISMPLFKIGLVVFLCLGLVLVLTQVVGIVTGSGGLVEGVVGVLGVPMTASAAVTGAIGFLMSYLHRWSGGED